MVLQGFTEFRTVRLGCAAHALSDKMDAGAFFLGVLNEND
jgi:hypothetical protein